MVLVTLCLLILLAGAGFLIWQGFESSRRDLKVRASNPDEPAPVSPAPAVAPTPALESAKEATGVEPIAVAVTNNGPVAGEALQPAPVTYQLQSIFYRAKNPSAVINGKTVYVGDRIAGAKVLTIDKDSATIVLPNGQTNILDLP